MSSPVPVCPRCGEEKPGLSLGNRCPDHPDVAVVEPKAFAKNPGDEMLGRVIGGKYPLVGVIGAGGMGSVYRALQEPVGRLVAVKVIREEAGPGEEALRKRFFREARAVAKLSHAAAVTLYDYGEESDGALYMVLELIKGQPLNEMLEQQGALPPERAVNIACQALGALAEAHELGLIHRDLKPHNIMIVQGTWGEEQAKVLDFGIAKMLRNPEEDSDETFQTRQGMVLGTPHYMAPEQAIGVGIGPQTDLYAMGIVLYEMLAGKVPFGGNTPFQVLMNHRMMPVPPLPAELGLPPALAEAVDTALAKEAEDRYASAGAMALALKQSLGASGR